MDEAGESVVLCDYSTVDLALTAVCCPAGLLVLCVYCPLSSNSFVSDESKEDEEQAETERKQEGDTPKSLCSRRAGLLVAKHLPS